MHAYTLKNCQMLQSDKKSAEYECWNATIGASNITST